MLDYHHRLIVISAPSGAGKSTIIQELLRKDENLCFSVSHTTRPIRAFEHEGEDYYYISKELFEERLSEDYFLEWALVHEHYYGTSYQEIDKKIDEGKKIILDIDVQGSLMIQKRIKALYIFIGVANLSILQERLYKRSTDSKEVIEKRLVNAKKELALSDLWPHVIENANFEQTVLQIEKLIQKNDD